MEKEGSKSNKVKEEDIKTEIAAEGSKVQVPKIKIIKDAAKVWEGKEALKKAFKARDSLYEVFNTRKIFFLI